MRTAVGWCAVAAFCVVLGSCARLAGVTAPGPTPASATPAASTPSRGVGPLGLPSERCGDVTAEWLGEVDDVATFFTGLTFRFGDGSVAAFKPSGEVFPPDWPKAVFAPDCGHAALPLDHYGPLALVPTPKLREFLASGQGAVVAQADAGTGPAQVLGDVRWADARHVEFTASCCGGASAWRASVQGGVEQLFFAASAPSGLERLDGGYRVRP